MAMLNNQREQKERKEGRCSGGGSREPLRKDFLGTDGIS